MILLKDKSKFSSQQNPIFVFVKTSICLHLCTISNSQGKRDRKIEKRNSSEKSIGAKYR